MSHLHALLRYLRIENEKGSLSLTALVLLVGCAAALLRPLGLGIVLFALGWAAYQFKESREQARALLAMETAQKIALAKRVDAAEELAAQMAALEAHVKELETPERARAVAEIADKLKSLGLRR